MTKNVLLAMGYDAGQLRERVERLEAKPSLKFHETEELRRLKKMLKTIRR